MSRQWVLERLSKNVSVRMRPAESRDKRIVLDFCRNTWPGGDYVADVWDEWLTDSSGRLVVATVEDRPVGLGHAYFQSRDVVWLEGLRVNPLFRGQGIAGKVNRYLTGFAREKGAIVARLCTDETNIPSRHHLKKAGFKISRRFLRLDSTRPLKTRPADVSHLTRYEAGLWRFVRTRPEFSQFRRLYADSWTWYPLTLQNLRNLCRARKVLVTRANGEIASLAIVSAEPKRLWLGFCAGNREHVTHLVLYLRQMLRARRFLCIRASVPRGSLLHGVLSSAGFKHTRTTIVYEKHLRGGSKKNKAVRRGLGP